MPSAPGARGAGEKSAGGFVISSPIILNALKILSPRVARRVVTGPIFQGQMGGRFLFASFLYFGWPKREMKPQMQLGAAE